MHRFVFAHGYFIDFDCKREIIEAFSVFGVYCNISFRFFVNIFDELHVCNVFGALPDHNTFDDHVILSRCPAAGNCGRRN